MLFLVGTIIGAGIFAVPAMIGAWGIILGSFGFAAVTAIVVGAHLLYAEALVAHPGALRFAGQASYWLGPWMKVPAACIQALFIVGSNFAYILLGGGFLDVLARMAGITIPLLTWQILFWIAGLFILFTNFSSLTKIQAVLSWALVCALVVVVFAFIPQMKGQLIFDVPSWKSFQPYGVFLFALLGLTAIPEANDIVEHRRDDLKKAVVRSTLLAAALTLAYGLAAWMASGGSLTSNPADAALFLPSWLGWAIPIFGLLAVITSYVPSALDVKNMLSTDLKRTPAFSWFVPIVVPFMLLFATSRNLFVTIGFVGSIFGAAFAALAALIGSRAITRSHREGVPSAPWWYRDVVAPAVVVSLIIGGIMWIFFHS
jgi:amino acid permease